MGGRDDIRGHQAEHRSGVGMRCRFDVDFWVGGIDDCLGIFDHRIILIQHITQEVPSKSVVVQSRILILAKISYRPLDPYPNASQSWLAVIGQHIEGIPSFFQCSRLGDPIVGCIQVQAARVLHIIPKPDGTRRRLFHEYGRADVDLQMDVSTGDAQAILFRMPIEAHLRDSSRIGDQRRTDYSKRGDGRAHIAHYQTPCVYEESWSNDRRSRRDKGRTKPKLPALLAERIFHGEYVWARRLLGKEVSA